MTSLFMINLLLTASLLGALAACWSVAARNYYLRKANAIFKEVRERDCRDLAMLAADNRALRKEAASLGVEARRWRDNYAELAGRVHDLRDLTVEGVNDLAAPKTAAGSSLEDWQVERRLGHTARRRYAEVYGKVVALVSSLVPVAADCAGGEEVKEG